MNINAEIVNGFVVIDLVSFDWVRGIRAWMGIKPKMVNYIKCGAQHIEYWSKHHKRVGCVHYLEFCINHFFLKFELILPNYYRYYLGFKPNRWESI